MFTFAFGCVILVAGVVIAIVADNFPRWARNVILAVAMLIGVVAIIGSTTLYVGPNEGGLIVKKFGSSLKEGHIVAVNGERGVQAEILSPGWSFGWWPWLYSCESVKNIDIPEGQVGIVVANDGQPLLPNEIYANSWDSPNQMIDALTFLTKGGCKGPQLTVLPPGQYRYNPKLFAISVAECVDISIGEVGVVRANAGTVYGETNLDNAVNGIQLVAKGNKGIWNEPLLPGKYYLHPNAYQVIKIKTTKRVYSYTSLKGAEANTANKKEPEGDNSIHVRSADSFEFPVDVRVAVMIQAQNAPHVVAKLGNPDSDSDKNGFELLEERAILPAIRAILRNGAEKQKAIEYVNSRSSVEANAFKLFAVDMLKDKIDTEGLYLADIGLKRTPEGEQLLKTQTDKEIAMQQQAQYQEQVKAEDQRALKVKAEEAANQQKRIQESLANIEFEKNGAEAAKNRASGEAAAYEAKVKALGGVENFTKLEIAKMVMEAIAKTWKGELPASVILGGGGSLNDVMTGVFAKQLQAEKK
jgi:hypothetical protein